jgi:hypothetical protein
MLLPEGDNLIILSVVSMTGQTRLEVWTIIPKSGLRAVSFPYLLAVYCSSCHLKSVGQVKKDFVHFSLLSMDSRQWKWPLRCQIARQGQRWVLGNS